MSLDDPNVIAGISTDGVPFFSDVAMMNIQHHNHNTNSTSSSTAEDPNVTPMPSKHSHPHGGGGHVSTDPSPAPSSSSMRDAEMKELRDFWRDYMRTPLSGPGTAMMTMTNNNPHHHTPTTSRSSSSRRTRVASLPSVNTPPAVLYPGAGHSGTSSIRNTENDDLRSYEAAVLARKPLTNLSLALPRRGRRPLPSQQQQHHQQQQQQQQQPASAGAMPSSSSSLASAF